MVNNKACVFYKKWYYFHKFHFKNSKFMEKIFKYFLILDLIFSLVIIIFANIQRFVINKVSLGHPDNIKLWLMSGVLVILPFVFILILQKKEKK